MTVAGVGLFGFGLMLVVLRLQDRPLVKVRVSSINPHASASRGFRAADFFW